MTSKLANDAKRRRLHTDDDELDRSQPSAFPKTHVTLLDEYSYPPRSNPFSPAFAADFRYNPRTQSINNVGNSSSSIDRKRHHSSDISQFSKKSSARSQAPNESYPSPKISHSQSALATSRTNGTSNHWPEIETGNRRVHALQASAEERQRAMAEFRRYQESVRREASKKVDRKPVKHAVSGDVRSSSIISSVPVTAAKRKRQREPEHIAVVPQFDREEWLDRAVQAPVIGGYDTSTIASDILRALGKHPTLPPLNAKHFGKKPQQEERQSQAEQEARLSAAYQRWSNAERKRAAETKGKESMARSELMTNTLLIRQAKDRMMVPGTTATKQATQRFAVGRTESGLMYH